MGLSVASCSDDDSDKPQQIEIKKGVIYDINTQYISGKGEAFNYSPISGDWPSFCGFMIDDNGVTEFQRGQPGGYAPGKYGRVTTKDYTYNPLTGELRYKVGSFWALDCLHETVLTLKVNEKGELYQKSNYGILPLGFPDTLSETEADPDSYQLDTFIPLPAEKAAEWMERFPQY